MTTIEKIRAEIERRYYRYGGGVKVMAEDAVDATMLELEDLLAFLYTLESEHIVDDDEEIIEEIIPVEEKDVDLSVEIERFYRSDEYKLAESLGRGFEAIARHFYNLRLNCMK